MTFRFLSSAALRILILIRFSLFSIVAEAASEVDLDRDWDQFIDAPWKACQQGEFFDELTPRRKIAYRRCGRASQGQPVLVIPGYTEPAMKYIELVTDLSWQMPEMGPWYLLDLPGQGASERLLNNSSVDSRIVHVDMPERYPLAVLRMINQVIKPENAEQTPLVIAHSTGALIFMSAAQKFPSLAKKSVMTAPLIWPKTSVPRFFISAIARLYCHIGLCEKTAWGRRTIPIEEKTFETNIATNSRARWLASHKISLKYPQYYSSGTSWGWLRMAMMLGSEVSIDQFPPLGGVLMLMADNDGYIEPSSSLEVCRKSSSCEAVTLKSSRHEILHEVDTVRNQAMEKIIKHFRGSL